MCDAFSLAMQRSIGVSTIPSAETFLSAFDAFDIEDDGSPEWNYMIDLIEMISAPISSKDVSMCLEIAVRVYLAGTFNMLARASAVVDGRPISYAEAESRLIGDPEWERSVNFVRAL